jgi:ribokinase
MIIVFGSINLDLIFPLPHLPVAGETVLGPTMRIEPGGKGANQAVAAARDGAQVAFAGAVGSDALADDALRLLADSGVDMARITTAEAATGCAAICVDREGRNLIAVASGANLAARHTQIEDALLRAGDTLLLQMEVPMTETEALIARARAAGMRIILNLAPAAPIALNALKSLDVLIANEEEAAFLATHLGSAPGAAGLHAALGVDVVVTLGGQGAEAATAAGLVRVPAASVQVVDTTGAGDCFTGVLAAGLDRGLCMADAIRRANTSAGLACTKPGTQGALPHAAETDAALN